VAPTQLQVTATSSAPTTALRVARHDGNGKARRMRIVGMQNKKKHRFNTAAVAAADAASTFDC
jgi:hypothetical protein